MASGPYGVRFTVLYVLLGFVLVCSATIFAMSALVRNEHPPTIHLPPIGNHTYPVDVDKHFTGEPLATVPASSLNLPDGTCWVYGNKVSWVVFECLGGQPEVMSG